MSRADESRRLGVKLVDIRNWMEADQASTRFAFLATDGTPRRIDGDEWARAFLRPQLSANCPTDVLVAFEAARGALVYGWFFYPLYALGQRELLHVAELAVRIRCEQLGVSRRKTRTFAGQISALREAEELTDEEFGSWSRLRKMRNTLVHAEAATITMPGPVAAVLGRIADLTNTLYA